MDEEGVVVRGLLLCVRGNEDGECRIRNRDKNASRNIWEVLDAMMRGADHATATSVLRFTVVLFHI